MLFCYCRNHRELRFTSTDEMQTSDAASACRHCHCTLMLALRLDISDPCSQVSRIASQAKIWVTGLDADRCLCGSPACRGFLDSPRGTAADTSRRHFSAIVAKDAPVGSLTLLQSRRMCFYDGTSCSIQHQDRKLYLALCVGTCVGTSLISLPAALCKRLLPNMSLLAR